MTESAKIIQGVFREFKERLKEQRYDAKRNNAAKRI